MQYLRIVIALLLVMSVAANTAWSDVTLTDDFTNESLVFQNATATAETYAFEAAPISGTERDVAVTRALLRTKPSIEATGRSGRPGFFQPAPRTNSGMSIGAIMSICPTAMPRCSKAGRYP